MADTEPQLTPIDNEEPEETPGYKAPAQKTLDEIQKLDAEDESLVRYKQMLLAGAEAAAGLFIKSHYFKETHLVYFSNKLTYF